MSTPRIYRRQSATETQRLQDLENLARERMADLRYGGQGQQRNP